MANLAASSFRLLSQFRLPNVGATVGDPEDNECFSSSRFFNPCDRIDECLTKFDVSAVLISIIVGMASSATGPIAPSA